VASKTAAANLQEARAQFEEAERVAERDAKLFASGTLTASEVDRSKTELTVARSRARAAELAAAATSTRGSQWQAAVAAQAFAEAGLVAAKNRAERLSVRAPAPGIVRERNVEVGDIVQPGSPLLTLVLDGPQELVIEPDEKNLATLSEEQRARASAEAFPGRQFEAKVSYIAPSVDPARGTIEVRLSVPDPPDYLRTDMTVSVDIIVDEADDALLVPRTAVVDLATPTPWVMVVEAGRTAKKPVQVGLQGSDEIEIVEGLDEGAVVVMRPDGVELDTKVQTEAN
jgi:HlyD family secretion protein